MTDLQIVTLGGFAILADGDPLPVSDRALGLLVYLLLHRSGPQPRRHVAFVLWPDSTEAQARTNLRALIHLTRRQLPGADELVDLSAGRLAWRPDARARVDVIGFEAALDHAAAARADNDPESRIHALEEAVSLYGGELLPGLYDEWIEPHRERLRHAYAGALRQLVEGFEQAGNIEQAARRAEQLVQHDPLDESAHLLLIRLLAARGELAAVQRQYARLVELLDRELGVAPSPATRAAVDALLTDPRADPAIPAAPAAPRLPPRPTPLVGRDEALAALGDLLVDPEHHLVTLVGMGGMGKTRLALEAAHDYASHFTHGATWVRLQSVSDASLLTTAVAEALALRFSEHGAPDDQLRHYLRERHLLLVLDNFEQLLDGVGWLAALLDAAPGLTVLVTSRIRLDLRGEWVWEVEGLPPPNDPSPAALEASGAARLFRQAARQRSREFAWDTPGARAAVVRLCRMLGGMPLALELAAAWCRLLTLDEILRELEQGLDFLQSGQVDLPERHRSLRAVFDHSWQLLAVDEQALLGALTVFQGPFSREAAERVAGATLAGLRRLLDSSLLRRIEDGRFTLHEAIRQYAAARLEDDPGRASELRGRHAAYYADWIARRESAIKSARQGETVAELHAHAADVRAAWAYAAHATDLARLEAMQGCLGWYYEVSGYLAEGMEACALAIERLDAAGAPESLEGTQQIGAYAFLLDQQGWFAARLGRTEEGIARIRRAIALAEPLGDRRTLYYAHAHLSYLETALGRLPEATAHAAVALEIARALDGEWEAAIALTLAGWLAHLRGDAERARADLEEGLALWRRVGEQRGLSFALTYLSAVAEARGDLASAERYLHESAELASQTGDRFSEASTHGMLGQLALRRGEPERALEHFRACRQLFAEVGETSNILRALTAEGAALRAAGRVEEAEETYRDALEQATASANRGATLASLLGLAALRGERGEAARAVEMFELLLPAAATALEPAALAAFATHRDEAAAALSRAELERARGRAAEGSVRELVDTILTTPESER